MIIDESHPFSSFGLSETVLEAIARKGWTAPSSIQSIALPRLLADEGHCIVRARTGTGKTAAFGIPLIERLTQASQAPRALILTPTRELALQVSREIASLVTGHYPRVTAVYGGASIRSQIIDLRRGTEIVVGTPGRIMDLMERKSLDVSTVDWFILDEADEMLDMGFFEDVEKILGAVRAGGHKEDSQLADMAHSQDARALHVGLFSATMPEPILKVVRRHIGEFEIIVDSAPEDEKPLVDQYCVMVRREDKLEALRRIIDSADEFYGLIFCATKVETDELARRLIEAGYPAEAIHGDLSQEIRERTLRRFRLRRHGSRRHGTADSALAGEPAILVATDVAARGLDIENLSHVINWDLPGDCETYLHRIGRTARAGRRGIAISLATLSERARIHRFSRMIEKNLGCGILWLKVPPVKTVMKALRRRISSSAVAALPEQPAEIALPEEAAADAAVAGVPAAEDRAGGEEQVSASPYLAKVCRNLIERLGAEKAVEALVTLSYGAFLDPGRYGPITEFTEEDFKEPARGLGRAGGKTFGRGRKEYNAPHSHMGAKPGSGKHSHGGGNLYGDAGGAEGSLRVYVGQGKKHGLGARDIAGILTRSGGVPSRLVDEIEMKDYCSFATLPAEAARRACTFSRNDPNWPNIRLARAPEHGK